MALSSTDTTTQTQSTTSPPNSGLVLQVDFTWSKFHNTISSKDASSILTPLYTQHFRPTNPQLRFKSTASKATIATGTLHHISIDASCILHNRTIELKPLKRWRTQYNYLSHALNSSREGIPVSWIANSTLKVWDFVCLNSATQEPIAKFSVNLWALKQVGNIYFEKSEQEVGEGLRDEVVVTGLTLLYVMMSRMNNPLQLLGSAFAKPGKVEGGGERGLELEERDGNVGGKVKRS